MGRIVAIDFGTRRTGVAITDELKIIASGLTTVETPKLIDFLKDYMASESVELLVIGEPKQRDGSHSGVEESIQQFIKNLKNEFKYLMIERMDERFTSKMAFQTMIDSGVKKRQRRNKAMIDEISATIILQDYLYSLK
jgi:putative Holliday junction resolvase